METAFEAITLYFPREKRNKLENRTLRWSESPQLSFLADCNSELQPQEGSKRVAENLILQIAVGHWAVQVLVCLNQPTWSWGTRQVL
jgi:hypothetical protein